MVAEVYSVLLTVFLSIHFTANTAQVSNPVASFCLRRNRRSIRQPKTAHGMTSGMSTKGTAHIGVRLTCAKVQALALCRRFMRGVNCVAVSFDGGGLLP